MTEAEIKVALLEHKVHELRAAVTEQHAEADRRFDEVLTSLQELRDQYTKVLAGVVVGCLVMLANVGASFLR